MRKVPGHGCNYALQVSGDLDKLDEALFRAIHDEHLQLFDASSLTDWVAKNGGHAEQFAAAYSSFGVNNQTVQADQLVAGFGAWHGPWVPAAAP